jgi:hypothetical protein
MLQEIEMDDLNLAIFRQIQKHWCCVCGGVVPRTPVTGAPPTFWCVECSMYCTVGGERGEGGEGGVGWGGVGSGGEKEYFGMPPLLLHARSCTSCLERNASCCRPGAQCKL